MQSNLQLTPISLIKKREYMKNYYKLNKEKIKEKKSIKYICNICNRNLLLSHKTRHDKSKIHIYNSYKDVNKIDEEFYQ